MKKYIAIIFLLSTLLSSCKKEVLPDEPDTIETEGRDYLYSLMNNIYYWYQLMPTVNKENYKDPYELMDAMIYKEVDRWSGIQSYEDFLAQSSGTFVGHGIMIGLDETNKARIAQIYNNSPMYSKGVRRGWIIKTINGTDLAQILIDRNSAAYSELLGPSEEGISNTFLFQMPDGRDSSITTTKSTFTLNTVLYADTLELKSGTTGHLVLDQFIPPSNLEFQTAFSYFKEQNITDLIIDLRYNGGGDLTVLVNLASYIAGSSKFGDPFLKLTHNNLNTSRNKTYNFNTVSYPLSLTKLIVICSRGTASASEDLINGLLPFMNVVCIGDTTNGKPVGMYGTNYKSTYMFWPIAFSLKNSDNQGEFYDGFFPEKYVPDDITHDFNSKDEACLKEAIYYLENGSTSAKSIYNYHPLISFPEKSNRIDNAYTFE